MYRVSTIQVGAGFLPSTRYVHFNREHDGLWIRRYLMWKFPNAINLPTKRGMVNNPSHWKTCVLGCFFGIGFTISWPTHKDMFVVNQLTGKTKNSSNMDLSTYNIYSTSIVTIISLIIFVWAHAWRLPQWNMWLSTKNLDGLKNIPFCMKLPPYLHHFSAVSGWNAIIRSHSCNVP